MPATVVTVHHRPIFQIAVTQATAAALHVGVGSALIYRGGELLVTGVLRPDHPAAAFWAYDQLLLSFNSLAETGGAFIGAGEVGALENLDGDSLTWNFPLLLGRVTASQAPAFLARLERAEHGGDSGLSLASPLNAVLAAFITTDDGIATVLALLFVSLTVLGLIVVLQGARLLSEHRAAEFAIMRARGASLRRLSWLAMRGGSVVAVPAAAAGLAVAVALRAGRGTAHLGGGAGRPAGDHAAVALAGAQPGPARPGPRPAGADGAPLGSRHRPGLRRGRQPRRASPARPAAIRRPERVRQRGAGPGRHPRRGHRDAGVSVRAALVAAADPQAARRDAVRGPRPRRADGAQHRAAGVRARARARARRLRGHPAHRGAARRRAGFLAGHRRRRGRHRPARIAPLAGRAALGGGGARRAADRDGGRRHRLGRQHVLRP